MTIISHEGPEAWLLSLLRVKAALFINLVTSLENTFKLLLFAKFCVRPRVQGVIVQWRNQRATHHFSIQCNCCGE